MEPIKRGAEQDGFASEKVAGTAVLRSYDLRWRLGSSVARSSVSLFTWEWGVASREVR